MDDLEYWAAQLRAAIEQMGVQAEVKEDCDYHDLRVHPAGPPGRKRRAHLIHALELRGFTVTSTTNMSYVTVEATDGRLKRDFVEVDDA